jgi:hypothetical protein
MDRDRNEQETPLIKATVALGSPSTRMALSFMGRALTGLLTIRSPSASVKQLKKQFSDGLLASSAICSLLTSHVRAAIVGSFNSTSVVG